MTGDLAELNGVETKRLKEAVKWNIRRFPENFIFEMTKEEFENWRSQFMTSKSDLMGLRYAPFCFTEQGVRGDWPLAFSTCGRQLNVSL